MHRLRQEEKKKGEKSFICQLDNASVIVEVEGGAGDRQGEEGSEGGEPGEEETKTKKRPSEISEMTDTRFHPVEVTTMFVSRRYAGTQATFPSRFPVKLMAATS
ncbi:hypothetical protein G5I_03969 [Acromyrmex echinatior]|uniref:Uncharacterized protein n=1 Tax=Acromyrmex echinatior TaxID=103372 RepID=F4WEG3_ACREC|nr:hypothetical protein G5I_03969 [Acromyrmex echinatior]